MARKFNYSIERRITNSIIKVLLRYDLAPHIYYLLTVDGRRSGKPHSIPVVLVKEDDNRWLVAPYGEVDWVKNARASGQVRLSRGKLIEKFSIQELSPQDAAPILMKYLREYPITKPYFDADLNSPRSAFVVDACTRPVFAIRTLDDFN